MSHDRPSSRHERAVVDRISDGWAILLVGDDETERRVREDDLAEGVREGSIVEVRLSGSRVEIVGVDEDATDRARGEVADRLARLRKTRSSRRFDTNRPDPT